jgi:3-dehydroquinate synthase
MNDSAVRVDLGARAYEIIIGERLLERAGALLAPHAAQGRVFILTDRNVWRAQGKRLAKSLKAAGLASSRLALAPGEASKSFRVLERVLDRFIAAGAERGDLLVAFGGGVVGDVAGLAAALLKRGCRLAQIPTSLLAQVDSAVGGKTAVNLAAGKNLAGTFHQPAIVLSDTSALATLDDREMRAGFAEIVKYGALGDEAFFGWLEANGARVLARDAPALAHAVRRCCEMKAEIVAADERESGRRALLNLGHTFGHAFEAAAGFGGDLLHGEAVAAGMGLAFDYSVHEGLCAPAEADRVKSILRASGLPAGVEGPAATGAGAGDLLEFMKRDKKGERGDVALVLARGIGRAFLAKGVDDAKLLAFLKARLPEGPKR